MLTPPLTLNDRDDKGLDQVVVTQHPAPPLADDDDDETQTGMLSPAFPWSSSSSSSSCPARCASTCSSASVTLSSFCSSPSSLTPLPPHPPPYPLTLFSTSQIPSPPLSSLCPSSHLLSSSHLAPSTLPTSLFPSLSLCPAVLPAPLPPSVSSPPPLPLSSSTHSLPSSPAPLSVPSSLQPSLLPPHSVYACPSVSSSAPPPILHISPLSSAPASVPTLHYHLSSLISSPPLPPILYPPLSSNSPSVPSSISSLLPPTSHSSTTPSAFPPAPPTCCSCSSLLPRLLSAHRLEIRRLLRGALSSLSRRLDSLERKSKGKIRKKRNRQRAEEGGGASHSCVSTISSFSSTSSSNLTHHPPVTSFSSSSDSEDSLPPPLTTSLGQSEQRKKRQNREGEGEEGAKEKKRRRQNHRRREINVPLENRDEGEEDAGRFVLRMAVSFGGGTEGGPLLLLCKYSHKEMEGSRTSQSETAISVFRRNGFRAPLLPPHSISGLFSQSSFHLLHDKICSQSKALKLHSGQWYFSNLLLHPKSSSSLSAFRLWLSSSPPPSVRPALMLQLSAVARETLLESLRGGACGSPLRPLKDWTAPPSLRSDHCYMRTPSLCPPFTVQRQLKQRSTHSLHRPQRQPLPLPICPANGLSVVLLTGQSAAGSELLKTNGERGKRVSQIRIRRAPPRETSLTPMGLPKVKRLKKKEFSLEEIYTNKNYKSPTNNRTLETIFEETCDKDGALLRIGHQRRRRLLLFPDFTLPRKRKRQGAGLPVACIPRKRAAARRCHGNSHADNESDLDVMLVERLSALEDFLTQQGLDV